MIFKNIKNYIKVHPTMLSIANILLPVIRPIFMKIKILKKKIYNLIDRKINNQKLMINIGGGYYFRRHWRVMDFPGQWYYFAKGSIDYEFDLTSGDSFPLASNSVSFFFSSHTLEHIPQECCQHIINEMYRCLKPGGAVRITMPDFDLAYEAFARNCIKFFVKYPGRCIEEKFLDFFATYMKDKIDYEELQKNFITLNKESFGDYYTQKIPRESQRILSGNHINWWNYKKISKMLRKAGFTKIYRSNPGESRFIEMRDIGRNCGFDSTHPEISLFVEAIK